MITTQQPTLQQFHIAGVNHITPANAFETLKNGNAFMIDVRETNELQFFTVDVENVLYHPMSVIMDRLVHIPNDIALIVACPGGVRASKVANLLAIQGFTNVANLDGGFDAWISQGFPVVSGMSMESGCGCSCSGGCC